MFNKDQVGVAKQLRTLRNDSVHYVPGYDFEAGSTEAVTLLMALLDSLFSALNRTDVFRVFEIPGEIWVRADRENDPFVKEFVLPCCTRMAAVSRLDDTGYSEDGARVGAMTETDFIHLRKEYQRAQDQFHDGRTPRVIEHETNGAIRKFVIP